MLLQFCYFCFETTSDEWGVDLCVTLWDSAGSQCDDTITRYTRWWSRNLLNEQHVSHRLLYLCTSFPNRGVTPGKKVHFTSQTWKLHASLVYSLWYQLRGSFLIYVQVSDSHQKYFRFLLYSNYNIPVCFNKDGCVHLKLPWVSWKTSWSLINRSTPSSMQRTIKPFPVCD